MSFAESSEACPEAQADRRDAVGLGHIDPTGLQGPEVRHVDLPLQVPPHRTGPLERRIKEICETRVRYGYRRVHVHLRRDGGKINMKNTRRITVS